MKKANEKIEGAVMEVVQMKKAKTVASQSVSVAAAVVAAVEDGGIDGGESDMELRSGKLEKPAELSDEKRQKCPSPKELNSMLRSKLKGGNGKKKRRCLDAGKIEEEKEKEEKKIQENLEENEKEEKKIQENGEAYEKMNKEEEENEQNINGDEDGFLGGKFSEEFDDGIERRTMENTPCNLIADADNVKTPGSSPKHPCSGETDSGEQKSILSDIPTTQEIEELFATEEKKLLQQFIKKYNFDFVNEKPLPAGRYEWET